MKYTFDNVQYCSRKYHPFVIDIHSKNTTHFIMSRIRVYGVVLFLYTGFCSNSRTL